MKYLGCDYYPEYWGVERVTADAQLMREAGVNIVRIGEFAWVRMEPAEGHFSLDWLHQTIDILEQHGIQVILCTPTATPPAWLTFGDPDTLLVKSNGLRVEHGHRRHYCYTSSTFQRHTRRIVEKLAEEFAHHQNVAGWQIDNEPDFAENGICYCEGCQAQFRSWLKEKYGTLEALNQSWGTGFWSMDYTDWSQVRLGFARHFSSRQLDTRRFASQMLGDYVLLQEEILHRHNPQAVVSTNLNGGIFTWIDYFRIFERMDVACKDLYFDICTMDVNALIMNQFRSFKPGRKYWITETGAGMCGIGRPSHPDQFKAWLWSSYAHGGDAHIVFRWRTCLSGQEQEIEGLLEHSGHPGHRYQAVKSAFLEMRSLSTALGDLPLPEAKVAFVHDYDVQWGYESSAAGGEIHYEQNLAALHRQLYRRGVLTDVISPKSDLEPYRLLILPSLMMLDADFCERLKGFVESGGVVLAQGQIGMRDRCDNYLASRGSKEVQDLFGVWINGGMYLHSAVEADGSGANPTHFSLPLAGRLGSGQASIWAGDLEANGCEVLLRVSADTYAGQPILVEKASGSGLAVYAAAVQLDEALLGRIFEYALSKAGLGFSSDVPEHVEVLQRGPVTFVINHRGEALSLDLNLKGKVLRGVYENGTASLAAYDVLIVDPRAGL